MIDLSEVTVRYNGTAVLDRVSMHARDGRLTYLLGRNGAGKSTLLRTACGIVRPGAGSVRIDGEAPRRIARPAAAIGVHLGADAAGSAAGPHPSHTGRRHLRWLAVAGGLDDTRVTTVLRRVGLADAADRRVAEYSLGMRQRLGIAAALLPDPPNLIFDEPVNGLDIDGIRWLRTLLRGLADDGRAVVIASHLFDEVTRTGDDVVVVERGRVVADLPLADFVAGHDDLETAYVSLIRPTTSGGEGR
ncbi:ATP-binding cassette domain-containing protein [Gordonia hydrophobica]|uniref:ATP-binding cassette domain-containing protein n=1 Tax=Gordonia hydrophobica TaxID=40516 RepID=A0ABZ2TYX1_9ACTN|nr:ATP-binding cassette domain-containing protein [Gordonia hydrophobica]MBM7367164.1 ABC-2 type transport system ATP-binding protein [Gordonia hydrophobica]